MFAFQSSTLMSGSPDISSSIHTQKAIPTRADDNETEQRSGGRGEGSGGKGRRVGEGGGEWGEGEESGREGRGVGGGEWGEGSGGRGVGGGEWGEGSGGRGVGGGEWGEGRGVGGGEWGEGSGGGSGQCCRDISRNAAIKPLYRETRYIAINIYSFRGDFHHTCLRESAHLNGQTRVN